MVQRVVGVGAPGPDTGEDFGLPPIIYQALVAMLDSRYGPGGGGGGGSADYLGGINRAAVTSLAVPADTWTPMVLPQKNPFGTHDSPDITWDDAANTATVHAAGLYYITSNISHSVEVTAATNLGIMINVAGAAGGPGLTEFYQKPDGPPEYPYVELNRFAVLSAGAVLTPQVYSSGYGFSSTGDEQFFVVRAG